MRRSGRAAIALSITLCAASVHAQRDIHEDLLRVNAYDDRLAEGRRLDEHREEEHREEAHREDVRIEQERLAEARREARIAAYDAWLAHWHETRSIEATTP